MTIKQHAAIANERAGGRPAERTNELGSSVTTTRRQMRPELQKLFDARWKRNEPGYRFLADR